MQTKITLLYAGLLGIIYLALSLNVVRFRWKEKFGLGHPNDYKSSLFRSIRIHANFMEYVPFILMMMFLDEVTGREATTLHIMGGTLIFARFCHFLGITKTSAFSPQRFAGVVLTFILLITLSVNLIIKGLQ